MIIKGRERGYIELRNRALLTGVIESRRCEEEEEEEGASIDRRFFHYFLVLMGRLINFIVGCIGRAKKIFLDGHFYATMLFEKSITKVGRI